MAKADVQDNAVIPSGSPVGWGAWHGRLAPDGTRNGVGPLGGPDQSLSQRVDASRGRGDAMTAELAEEGARARGARNDQWDKGVV